MQTDHLSRLIQEIKENEDYWTEPNLARSYIEQILVPLLQSTLSEVLAELHLRHEEHAVSSGGKVRGVHYTTIGVLMQLLQTQGRQSPGVLRYYDSVHLNDPDEGNYLRRRISLDSQLAWLAHHHTHSDHDEIDSPFSEIA